MNKNNLLIIAGILVLVAILLVILVPKNSNKDKSASISDANTQTSSNTTKKSSTKSISKVAVLDEEGNIVINKNDVSEDKISLLKYSEDSKIEVIAIKGKDGEVKAALRNMLFL